MITRGSVSKSSCRFSPGRPLAVLYLAMALNIHLPKEWKDAADQAIAAGGPVLVLGAVDTGKSTFVRYLLSRHIKNRGLVALLDGDVGMATVGTPGVVGLTLVRDVDTLDERPGPDRAWFVGSTRPNRFVLSMVLGHARLSTLARETGVATVINSGGFVQGPLARDLHLGVAEVCAVKHVVGLSRNGEIEHLLTPLERRGIPVTRIAPSPRAQPKPSAFRSRLRADRFTAYFEKAARREIDLRRFAIEGAMLGAGDDLDDARRRVIEKGLDTVIVEAHESGAGVAMVLATEPHDSGAEAVAAAIGCEAMHVLEAPDSAGVLVGFLGGDGECLGLGLVDDWPGDGRILVHTPLTDAQIAEARRFALGEVRIGRTGEDFGMWAGERELGAVRADTTTGHSS